MGLTPFTYLEESEYKQFKAKQESDKFAGAKATGTAGSFANNADKYSGMMPQPRFTPMDVVGNALGGAWNAAGRAMQTANDYALDPAIATTMPYFRSASAIEQARQSQMGAGQEPSIAPFDMPPDVKNSLETWRSQNQLAPFHDVPMPTNVQAWNDAAKTQQEAFRYKAPEGTPALEVPFKAAQDLQQTVPPGALALMEGVVTAPFGGSNLFGAENLLLKNLGKMPGISRATNAVTPVADNAWDLMKQKWNGVPGDTLGKASGIAERLVPANSIERYGPKMGETLQGIGPSTPEKIADAYSVGTGLKRTPEPVSDWLRRTQDKATLMAYDKLYPLKRVQGQGYALARTVPGQIARGEQMGKVMDKAIKKVGSDLTTQRDYVRFLSLMDDMDQISFSAADKFAGGLNAAQIGTEYSRLYAKYGPQEMTRWKQLSHEVWDTGQKVLDEMVDAGVLKADNAQALKDAHPHYMPKFRDEFDDYIPGQSAAKAAATDSTGIRTRGVEGSYRNVDDMLTNWKSNLIYGLMRAQRNRAAQAIKKGLDDMAAAEGRSGPIKVGTEPGQTKLHFFENGESVAYDVPEDIGIAANSLLNEPGAGTIGKVFSALAAPLRYGAVTWNSAFIPKNMARDMISAWTREGILPVSFHIPFTNIGNFSESYLGGVISALRQDPNFARAMDKGVLMSGMVENWRAPTVRRLAETSGGNALTKGATVVKKIEDILLIAPKKIEQVNTILEQAPRVAVTTKLARKGVDPLEAALRARDVTVDFAKSGTFLKAVNLAIPFINANVQGSANTIRALRGNPTLFLLRASPAVAATFAMDAWNSNAYGDLQKKIPLDLFKNNWVMIYGTYEQINPQFPDAPPETMPKYFVIPKGQYAALSTVPFELYIRGKLMANDPVYKMTEENPWAALSHEMALSMFSAVSPIDIERGGYSSMFPPVMSTIASLYLNKDDYTKRSIVPESLQQYSEGQQFREGTSRLAVALGQALNISPMQVEYAIKDMAGGLGQQALWGGDKALETLGYNPKAPGYALVPEKSDTEKNANIPIYSSFVKSTGTAEEQTGREGLNKILDKYRSAWDQNPEHKKLGIALGEVSGKITVDRGEVEIPWLVRVKYQEDWAKVGLAATDAVAKQDWYKKADVKTQEKYLEDIHKRAKALLQESVKAEVQGKKATTSADAVVKQMPELASAYKHYLDYKALPAVLGITDQESRLYDAFYTTMQDLAKQNDWTTAKAYIETKKAYTASIGEERALKYIQAYNKVQNKPENPARKKMRDDKTIGVLLKRWFGI